MSRRSCLMFVSSVVLAALLTVPTVASAANGPPLPTDKRGVGTLCGHMYDANTGSILNGAVFIMEIIKEDIPIYVMVYDGYYEFKKVPVGTYTLRATANNYEVEYRPGVEIARDQVTVEDFTLRPAGNVGGVVRDSSSGGYVEDARVYLVDGQAHNYDYSGSTGYFRILNVIPGTYTLAIEKDGYAPYVHPAPIVVREWLQTWMGDLYIVPL